MKKIAKIRSIINVPKDDAVKSGEIVDILNKAIQIVLDDYFRDLLSKGLLSNPKEAERAKNILSGQLSQKDYPEL